MVIDSFAAALRENACGVHGPYGSEEAADTAVALAIDNEGDGAVAIAPGDPLVGTTNVAARIAASGARVLAPGDAGWRERMPAARSGVTGAHLGVAATGTLALVAGPGAPRAVSLLPPVHVCLIATGDVVASLAEAVEAIAAAPLPSAVTWIGGPSRTGDLEMVTTMGVHGPRRLEVVLVDGPRPIGS